MFSGRTRMFPKWQIKHCCFYLLRRAAKVLQEKKLSEQTSAHKQFGMMGEKDTRQKGEKLSRHRHEARRQAKLKFRVSLGNKARWCSPSVCLFQNWIKHVIFAPSIWEACEREKKLDFLIIKQIPHEMAVLERRASERRRKLREFCDDKVKSV